MKWKDKKDELEKLIKDGETYEEIGRKYGCTGSNIKKIAKRLGIELETRRKINENEHFNKGTAKTATCQNCGKEFVLYKSHGGLYCCHECWAEGTKKKAIEDWKNGNISGHDSRYKIRPSLRDYILKSRDCKCERCGFSGINPYTGKSILQLHHKNGDAADTSEENIEVLCPNCHAMTENFGSRNKSSVRKYRKDEYRKIEDEIKGPVSLTE